MTDELAAIEARQRCETCGKPHDLRPSRPNLAPTWADLVDGHPYRRESWAVVADRLLAALHAEQEARAGVEAALTAERRVARIKRDHEVAGATRDQRWWSGYTEGLEFALVLATPEPVEGEPTDMEPCDICDIRGGHDVHCIRYPHNRPRVTVIWKTAADRLAPDASEGEPK